MPGLVALVARLGLGLGGAVAGDVALVTAWRKVSPHLSPQFKEELTVVAVR